MELFHLKRFSLSNERSAQKVGTDAILLGSAATIGAHNTDNNYKILDIGTGTGIIALMIAQRISDSGLNAEITGIDIDRSSFEEAQMNFDSSPWSEMMSAVHSSLQDYSKVCRNASIDLIISNPPFYDDTLTAPEQRRNVSRHTGVSAEDGTSLSPEDIIEFAAEALSDKGILSMIVPADFRERLSRAGRKTGLSLHRIMTIKTTERKPAKRMIIEFCKGSDREPVLEELVLNEEGKRTEQFISLTNSFYI